MASTVNADLEAAAPSPERTAVATADRANAPAAPPSAPSPAPGAGAGGGDLAGEALRAAASPRPLRAGHPAGAPPPLLRTLDEPAAAPPRPGHRGGEAPTPGRRRLRGHRRLNRCGRSPGTTRHQRARRRRPPGATPPPRPRACGRPRTPSHRPASRRPRAPRATNARAAGRRPARPVAAPGARDDAPGRLRGQVPAGRHHARPTGVHPGRRGLGGEPDRRRALRPPSGLSDTEVAALEGFGLVEPMSVAGVLYYDEEALTVAKLVAEFGRYGIEPRHLRLYRNAVDREVGLIEQIITPLLRQRNPDARQRAVDARPPTWPGWARACGPPCSGGSSGANSAAEGCPDALSTRAGPEVAALHCLAWSKSGSGRSASTCSRTRRCCCCRRPRGRAGRCRSSSGPPRPRPSPTPSRGSRCPGR